MEIKTNIELLNEISAKLGGKSDASVLVEGLNNIANALGDSDPDQMVTVSQALETVLDHMDGGGGGGDSLTKLYTVTIKNEDESHKKQIAFVGESGYIEEYDTYAIYGLVQIPTVPPIYMTYDDKWDVDENETKTLTILGIIGRECQFTGAFSMEATGDCRVEEDPEDPNRWTVYTYGDCEIKATASD